MVVNMDLLLLIASVLVLFAAVVILYLLKRKQYIPLLYVSFFVLFGLVDVVTGHNVLYGVGAFVLAAIVLARYVVNRTKVK
jgi:hypothetical protein